MERDNSSGFHAKDIREPRVTSAYYISLHNLSSLLKKAIQNSILQEKSGLVLDLGCGEKPYQTFLAHRYDRYVGVDIKRNSLADVIAYGEYLPFRDDLFRACLCIEAYEHTRDPYGVTREVSRVLKPNGVFVLSAPGTMPIHNYPNDYWRWTAEGFRNMLSGCFSHVKVQEVTTPFETFFQIVLMYLPAFGFGRLSLRAFINRLAGLFRNNPLNTRLPKLVSIYLVVAKKEKG